MGRIIMPPNPIYYDSPKAIGKEVWVADILGRAMVTETIRGIGDYRRIIDRLKWREDNSKNAEQIRFAYYYRKPNGTENDWVFGQGAGQMTAATLIKLIKKAQTNPDFGNFGSSLNEIKID